MTASDDDDARIAELEARCAELEARRAELEARCARLEARGVHESCRSPRAPAPLDGEALYRTIFESEPACVKLLDRDGRLLSMNPAGLEMVGARDPEQVLGMPVEALVVPRDRARFRAMHERVFAGESVRLEFEIEGLQGRRLHMESISAPFLDGDGRVLAQLAVTQDITSRRREQAELQAYRERLEDLVAERTRELEASRAEARRSERLAALGTLAAGLAHELNNPLGTILLGTELARESDDPEARAAALEGIQRDVARCSRIVKSMLRFGHDESSEKYPIAINQIVRSALHDTRDALRKREIQVDAELAASLPLVQGHPGELGRVLINLVENAARASDHGGRIILRTTAEGAHVRCVVEDAGCGMSVETRGRACDPFYTTRLDEGGTGLGLSVSHGIVADHGGSLDIESEEGRGTRITIELPIALARPVDRKPVPANGRPADPHRD